MNRATLIFLACPAFLAAPLLAHKPAQAAEVTAKSTDTKASTPNKPVFEVVFERPTAESPTSELTDTASDDAFADDDCGCSGETPMLNFTAEESNAAIKQYGCDCAGCINAVRQLQGKLPLL